MMMMKRKDSVNKLTCNRCGHQWWSRIENPTYCPRCHSVQWNQSVGFKEKYWESRRWWNFALDDFICVLCGRKEDLVLHHWKHDISDINTPYLITICRSCNSKFHTPWVSPGKKAKGDVRASQARFMKLLKFNQNSLIK